MKKGHRAPHKKILQICASPYLCKELESMIENEDFTNMSDLCNTALIEFVTRYKDSKEKIKSDND